MQDAMLVAGKFLKITFKWPSSVKTFSFCISWRKQYLKAAIHLFYFICVCGGDKPLTYNLKKKNKIKFCYALMTLTKIKKKKFFNTTSAKSFVC